MTRQPRPPVFGGWWSAEANLSAAAPAVPGNQNGRQPEHVQVDPLRETNLPRPGLSAPTGSHGAPVWWRISEASCSTPTSPTSVHS
jgi:hypothetical protein